MTEHHLSLRELSARLVERTNGARGTSFANLATWVNGQGPQDAEPRVNIVRALAEIFGVLPDYLLYGGPKTEQERALRDVQEDEGPNLFDMLAEAIPSFNRLAMNTQLLFVMHLNRWSYAQARDGRAEPSLEEAVAYATNLWGWMWHPVAGQTRNTPVELMADYFDAALHTRNLGLNFSGQAPSQE